MSVFTLFLAFLPHSSWKNIPSAHSAGTAETIFPISIKPDLHAPNSSYLLTATLSPSDEEDSFSNIRQNTFLKQAFNLKTTTKQTFSLLRFQAAGFHVF